jgi:transposase-like protein
LQGRELQVRKKQAKRGRPYRYSNEFKAKAVERMKGCDNITALAEELGIHKRMLYWWRQHGIGPVAAEPETQPLPPEVALRRENQELKQLLADKVREVDFFRGALQKVEARRQPSGKAGEPVSTPKSGQ